MFFFVYNTLLSSSDLREEVGGINTRLSNASPLMCVGQQTKNPKLLLVKGLIVGPPGLEPGTT
jgi:hypothetical protein